MNGKVTVTGANKVFFTFAVSYTVFQFILVILASIYGEGFLTSNTYEILLINQYIVVLVPVIVHVLYKRLDITETFRLRKLSVTSAVIIVLMALPAQFAANMLNSIVAYLLQHLGEIPVTPIPVPRNPSELATGILVIAVSPAICEELLHRGLMLKAYENRGSLKAIIITSIFFGIFHFDITNFLGAAFLGLLIGYYVIRTNSIFAGMLAHFLNNAIYELMQYFNNDSSPPESRVSVTGSDMYAYVLYGLAGLILLFLLLIVFNRATRDKCVLKPSISSLKEDAVSILSHWPVIAVLLLYAFFSVLTLLSIIYLNV